MTYGPEPGDVWARGRVESNGFQTSCVKLHLEEPQVSYLGNRKEDTLLRQGLKNFKEVSRTGLVQMLGSPGQRASGCIWLQMLVQAGSRDQKPLTRTR